MTAECQEKCIIKTSKSNLTYLICVAVTIKNYFFGTLKNFNSFLSIEIFLILFLFPWCHKLPLCFGYRIGGLFKVSVQPITPIKPWSTFYITQNFFRLYKIVPNCCVPNLSSPSLFFHGSLCSSYYITNLNWELEKFLITSHTVTVPAPINGAACIQKLLFRPSNCHIKMKFNYFNRPHLHALMYKGYFTNM